MRTTVLLLSLLLVACALGTPLARAQEQKPGDDDEQAKEELRLLKKARRHVEDEEKTEAWQAYGQLAQLAQSREHWKTAITALDESRAVAPTEEDEAQVCGACAHLELREGEHAASARHYRRAAKLLPKDVRIWNNYGYALHLVGKDDEAQTAYEHCLELDPSYSLAKVSVGESARLAGDPKKALKIHQKLLDQAKQGDIGSGGWFWAFESKKQKPTAKLVSFESAEQRRALVALQVAVDHAFLDDLGEVESTIEAARKDVAASDLAPAIEKALDDLHRALEIRPAHFQLHYVLGLLLEAKGDDAGSKEELTLFVEAEKEKRPFAKKAREKVAR